MQYFTFEISIPPCIGIGAVISGRFQAAHRVHFYLTTVKRDADAAMFDGGKDNLLAALGLERVCLDSSVLLYSTLLPCAGCEGHCCHQKQHGQ